MKSKALAIMLCLLALATFAAAQDAAKRQLVVPLAEGGFVAFKSETSWTDAKTASTELQRGLSVLNSQAVIDDRHIIHRVLEDSAGRIIFGYDLWVAPNVAAKQFKIEVHPLDRQFETKLRAEKTKGREAGQTGRTLNLPQIPCAAPAG